MCCLYIFDSIDTHNITLHTHALSLTSVSTIKNPLHQVHHSCRHPECTSTHHYRDVSPLSISPMTLFTLSSFLTHSPCCALLPLGIDVLCPPWTVGGSSIHGNVFESPEDDRQKEVPCLFFPCMLCCIRPAARNRLHGYAAPT